LRLGQYPKELKQNFLHTGYHSCKASSTKGLSAACYKHQESQLSVAYNDNKYSIMSIYVHFISKALISHSTISNYHGSVIKVMDYKMATRTQFLLPISIQVTIGISNSSQQKIQSQHATVIKTG